MKPDVVVTNKTFPWMQSLLDAEFTSHSLSASPPASSEDRATRLKSLPNGIRALASFAGYRVDAELMDALRDWRSLPTLVWVSTTSI
jgi:hypothetical protein